MTDYLLDTNTCIEIRRLLQSETRRDPKRQSQLDRVQARWQQVPKERLAMSLLTLGELHYGAEKSQHPAQARAKLQRLRQAVQVLLPEHAVGEHYGQIRAHLEQAGTTIGANDLWIAAHARASGCTLVSNNQREFARVPDLHSEDWTA